MALGVGFGFVSRAESDADRYLESAVVQLHDDGLGSAHPALHVHEGGGGRAARWGQVAGRLTVSAFRQVLVHVLGKVAQQSQPLAQIRRHRVDAVAARLLARVLEIQSTATHTKTRPLRSRSRDPIFWEEFLIFLKKIPATDGVGVLPPITGEADPRAVVEEDTDGSIRQLEAKSVLVRVIDPLGDEERVGGHGGRIGRR